MGSIMLKLVFTQAISKKRKRKKYVGSEKPHPNWRRKVAILVLGTVEFLHQEKKKKISWDQEDFRLGLKPAPHDSW